jgi:uncharacterized repeat protein (TIGR03803 family)
MKNRIFHNLLAASLALLGLAAASLPGTAQVTFRTIYTLGGVSQPAGLYEARPGLFYSSAGSYQLFTVNTKGEVEQIASPPKATSFGGPPFPAANDRAYSGVGNNIQGQPFNVVSVTPEPGSMIIYPGQSLNFAYDATLPDGAFLGTASDPSNGLSSIAIIDLSGNVTKIWEDPSWTNGIYSNVIYASDGNYYGVDLTDLGGPPQEGASYVFQVTPSGVMNRIFTFPNNVNGSRYVGYMLQGNDGNLYLETPFGGASGSGAMYQITLAGQAKIIYSYLKGASAHPGQFIQASDGNFYGGTFGGYKGVADLYRLTLGGQYTTLHKMNGPDGLCGCNLMQASDGIFYGTTVGGGSNGAGTVFALDAHLPKPAPQALAFRPSSGPPGTHILIWGNNLLAASVHFNGTPAKAHSSGPNYVIATVPAGATTGPLTVMTPGGASTTTASFTVQ